MLMPVRWLSALLLITYKSSFFQVNKFTLWIRVNSNVKYFYTDFLTPFTLILIFFPKKRIGITINAHFLQYFSCYRQRIEGTNTQLSRAIS